MCSIVNGVGKKPLIAFVSCMTSGLVWRVTFQSEF